MPESGRPKGKLEKRETGERLARQMNGNRIWLKTFFDEEHSSLSSRIREKERLSTFRSLRMTFADVWLSMLIQWENVWNV